jgi:hypothetical protein
MQNPLELDECIICSLDYSNSIEYITSCNHKYHKKCLEECLKNSSLCPICRTHIPKDKANFPNYSGKIKNEYNWESEIYNQDSFIRDHIRSQINDHMNDEGFDPNVSVEDIMRQMVHIRQEQDHYRRERVEVTTTFREIIPELTPISDTSARVNIPNYVELDPIVQEEISNLNSNIIQYVNNIRSRSRSEEEEILSFIRRQNLNSRSIGSHQTGLFTRNNVNNQSENLYNSLVSMGLLANVQQQEIESTNIQIAPNRLIQPNRIQVSSGGIYAQRSRHSTNNNFSNFLSASEPTMNFSSSNIPN